MLKRIVEGLMESNGVSADWCVIKHEAEKLILVFGISCHGYDFNMRYQAISKLSRWFLFGYFYISVLFCFGTLLISQLSIAQFKICSVFSALKSTGGICPKKHKALYRFLLASLAKIA